MGLFTALVSLQFAASGLAAPSASVDVRLRLAWGGGAPRRWEGAIAVVGGAVRELTPLGIEADSPGAMWIEDGQRVRIAEPSPRTYDGCDITVTAPLSSELTILLTPVEPAGERRRIVLPLAEVLAEQRFEPLDDQGNRLAVSRAPGDMLRVSFPRDALIYSPGETLEFEVSPALPQIERTGAWTLRAQLSRARGGSRIWSREDDFPEPTPGAPASVKLDLAAPAEEGAYDLTLTLVERRRRLAPGRTLAERSVQFVVVGEAAPAAEVQAAPPDEVVVEIDPAAPRWWDRMAGFGKGSLRRGPLGSGQLEVWSHSSLGALAQLRKSPRADDASWEAYPLPGLTPGQVYVLEIEYPDDQPQELGLSVLEAGPQGGPGGAGVDAGVYLTAPHEGEPHRAVHRVPFWPRSSQPVLLVTNRSTTQAASFGKIRVLGGKQRSALARGFGARPPVRLPPLVEQASVSSRWWGGYLSRPLLAENFLVEEGVDPATGRSLDDWPAVLEASNRLIESLRYAGQNALALAVLADGSTLYPSQLVQPTPRHDSGIFYSNGQDPLRKDVLELLFRKFDREGLVLVPMLDFSSPLPELEELARAQGRASVANVGPDGRTWIESHPPERGLAPYYNPLQPAVQAAMLGVVRELVERYGNHPSFGGLTLHLPASSYARAPGAAWGLDDQTLARFAADDGLSLPSAAARSATWRGEFVASHRQAWLAWRARQMSAFYAELRLALAAAGPERRLYLAPVGEASDLFEMSARSVLLRQERTDELALDAGLDLAALEAVPGLNVFHTRVSPTPEDDVGRWAENELGQAFFGRPRTGLASVLLWQSPQRMRLGSFAAKLPTHGERPFFWQASPGGDEHRRCLAQALAAADTAALFEGGWMLTAGQDAALRGFITAFRALPAGAFETIADAAQPVVVRLRSEEDATFAYFVNDSPWTATASVRVTAAPNCEVVRLGVGPAVDALPANLTVGRWAVSLGPYELLAVRFSQAGVRLSEPRVQVDPRAPHQLEQRVLDLAARAASLESPRVLPGPANSDFESLAKSATPIPGWRLVDAGRNPLRSEGVDAEATLVEDEAAGKVARLTSGGPPATLVSEPFAAPASGRMFLRLLLRSPRPLENPQTRLVVEQSSGGQLSWSAVAGGAAAPISDRWRPYILRVDELPAHQATPLQVRIELQGAGEVWIDDVQILDPPFSPSEHTALRKLIKLAEYQLEQRQYADCARFVDGFWGRYLTSTAPAPPLVADPPPPPAAETAQREPPPKSMMDRWRGAWRWW
ncbi:MAG: family 10 glycosylhydrolase [Pirellulales bacterium]